MYNILYKVRGILLPSTHHETFYNDNIYTILLILVIAISSRTYWNNDIHVNLSSNVPTKCHK